MIAGKKIVVVMPAYNAEPTLERTYKEIPFNIIDEVILVDDHSRDQTFLKAKELGIKTVIRHELNKGYGGNQKTCYNKALENGADIVVMLHPDYQYTPLLLEAMIYPIAHGLYDVMLASRILGQGALKGGMPFYKYVANRFLTFFQNIMMSQKLSEYHTGYRAFTREVLETLPLSLKKNIPTLTGSHLAPLILFFCPIRGSIITRLFALFISPLFTFQLPCTSIVPRSIG